MPSNRGKKKRIGHDDGEQEDLERWKGVTLNMELLQEFEGLGGVFIEEATEDVSVTYGLDGSTKSLKRPAPSELNSEGNTKKRKRKKTKDAPQSESLPAQQLGENGKTNKSKDFNTANSLSQELAALRAASMKGGQTTQEEATPEDDLDSTPDLPLWIEYDLHPSLLRNIARLGFEKPTGVQARCLTPAIRQRKDVVGAAETGSGKTLAFGLPILHHILNSLDSASPSSSSSKPKENAGVSTCETKPVYEDLKALAILPTRELAVQVRKHLNDAAEGTEVRTACVVGGMSLQKQSRLLSRRPAIVVGTPGRMSALLGLTKEAEFERCDWLINSLQGLRHLVLDEADRLVEAGHFRELDAILGLVYSSLARPAQLQTFVFSATLTLNPQKIKKQRTDSHDEDKVAQLSNRLQFREPRAVHIVDLNGPGGGASTSKDGTIASKADGADGATKNRLLPEQLVVREALCGDDKEKDGVLAMWLLNRFRWLTSGEIPGGRVILFVNSISSVLRLTPIISLMLESPSADLVLAKVRLTQGGKHQKAPDPLVHVLGLHSKLRQKDRLKRVERFRSSPHAVLICTDVAARGLDVKDVAAVMHYHTPRNAETFVHRSGRTARAGRQGETVTLLGPKDHFQWQKLCRATGIMKDRISHIDTTAIEIGAAREATRLATDLESKVHKADKQNRDKSWLKKAADEAELMLDGSSDDDDNAKESGPRRDLWNLWQQLQTRVRRQPKRLGAGPLGIRPKR